LWFLAIFLSKPSNIFEQCFRTWISSIRFQDHRYRH
jgi:hypothetical protein